MFIWKFYVAFSKETKKWKCHFFSMVSNQRNIILYLHFDVFGCFLKNFHVQNFDTDKCQDDCEYQKTTSHVTVTPRTIRYLIITLTN